ncbi:type II toxin-antitoxin system RelE/ParE family toxin [Sphingomonas oryzagri]
MQVIETLEFSDWLAGLRDVVARRAIVKRLTRIAATDHFGDADPVGGGVSEMRFHMGPGYRVYYITRDGAVILCGGDKGSQDRDIAKAKAMAAEFE